MNTRRDEIKEELKGLHIQHEQIRAQVTKLQSEIKTVVRESEASSAGSTIITAKQETEKSTEVERLKE